MTKQPDYYLILNLPSTATTAEIHAAARELANKFPEEARDPSINAAYRQLLAAYEVLSDPVRRAEYDQDRARRAPNLLQVTTQLSRTRINALDDDQLLYLLVNLRAPEQTGAKALPLNLVFVFDRSTSMSGERLARVKAAVRDVIDKLSPSDVLSVVTFSDRAEVVWESSHVEQRERVMAQINQIQASGGTEIYHGLKTGLREMTRWPLERYINHLVLLTDGHTYGDEDKCLDLARQAANRGVALSAFGIGDDWNDQFLDQLVVPSGGRSAYIEMPSQIAGYLREQVNGLGATYAHNIRLNLRLPPGVRCNDAIKLSPYSLPLECGAMPIQLGTVEQRAPLSLLLELVVSPQRKGAELSLALDLVADIPSQQIRNRSFFYKESVLVDGEDSDVTPPPIVVKAVQMLNLHRINEKAWREFEAGQTEKATRRMKVLTTRLLEAGHTDLAQQAEHEQQRLAQMGTLSLQGRKRLKYGTRSLLTTAVSSKRRD